MADREVVHVVGAGFAGAACALKLADAGRRVVLWEAGAAPGGRAISRRDPESNEVLDNGPHLFMDCYDHARGVLKRLGTDNLLAFQDRLHIPVMDGGRRLALSCPQLPGPLHLVAGLLGLGGSGLVGRVRALVAGDRLKSVDPRVDETVADYLARVGAPAASVRVLWDPLCRAVMNLALTEAAAGPFVAALRIALLQGPRRARLGWARVGLGELFAPLGKELAEAGGELRRGRVRRISVDPDGAVAGIEGPDHQTHAVRRVVIAADPWNAALMLNSCGGAASLAVEVGECGKSSIVSVYYWLDRQAVVFDRLSPFIGFSAAPASQGGGAEWVFDRDRLEGLPPGTGQRLVTITSAAEPLMGPRRAEVAATVWRSLVAEFPELRRARILRSKVIKEGRSTPRLMPGTSRPAPGAVPRVPGLFLCGDLTDTGLPATMEAAALSGEVAAARVLDD
ncbi:MAG: hydroxysqualene dehydroxylase HpnE [Nitrospirota bacterium]|nr:hydroxysqualene dehydroxylase HpnE [Nitrospirota bacterium]